MFIIYSVSLVPISLRNRWFQHMILPTEYSTIFPMFFLFFSIFFHHISWNSHSFIVGHSLIPIFCPLSSRFMWKQAAPKAKKAAPKKVAAKKVFRCRPLFFFFHFFHSRMSIMSFMMIGALLCLLLWWMLVIFGG